MPIKRRIVKIGDAKGITLPKSWLEIVEKATGQKLKYVAMEVDSILKIMPLIKGQPYYTSIPDNNRKKIEEEEKRHE